VTNLRLPSPVGLLLGTRKLPFDPNVNLEANAVHGDRQFLNFITLVAGCRVRKLGLPAIHLSSERATTVPVSTHD
jgi:hypothetical protein